MIMLGLLLLLNARKNENVVEKICVLPLADMLAVVTDLSKVGGIMAIGTTVDHQCPCPKCLAGQGMSPSRLTHLRG